MTFEFLSTKFRTFVLSVSSKFQQTGADFLIYFFPIAKLIERSQLHTMLS